jgi:hypothetical protein
MVAGFGEEYELCPAAVAARTAKGMALCRKEPVHCRFEIEAEK